MKPGMFRLFRLFRTCGVVGEQTPASPPMATFREHDDWPPSGVAGFVDSSVFLWGGSRDANPRQYA